MKESKVQYLGATSKMTEWSLFPRQTIQYHSIPSLCTNHWCWRSQSWLFLWRPRIPSRTTTKDVLLTIGESNGKVGSKEIPGVTGKFGLGVQNEAGQRLTEFCQENALVIANTLFQQHKRQLHTRTSPDGHYWNLIDYIICSQRWSSYRESAKARPGAGSGSDHELLIAKFRLKLKKVEKTTRPFKYNLNQIPYSYTVEVTKRLKGIDLIECLNNYGQRFVTLYRRQWSRPFPRKRNAKRQNGCLRGPYKLLRKEEKPKAKEKSKDIPIGMQSSRE